MTFKPLGNRVVIDPIPLTEAELTKGEIKLSEDSVVFQKGKVELAGPGTYATSTGTFMPNTVRVGDTVLFFRQGPHLPFKMPDGRELRLMREQDIDCVIE